MDEEWAELIKPIFENLEKQRIESGMLLDYAMEFTNLNAFNGSLTDSTYVDKIVLNY